MKSVPSFPNAVCWEPASRPCVTNTIALDVLPAVFLAVHSPSLLRQAGVDGSSIAETEEHFLADFLDVAHDQVFELVVGDFGSGKSHLIRWMYFEITRLNAERGNKWHVVLIPDAARWHEFIAPDTPTPDAARHRALDELARLLENEETLNQPGARPLSDDEREIRRALPAFLRDDALREWLTQRAELDSQLGDPVQLHWDEKQLELPPEIYRKASSHAQELAGLLMSDQGIRQMSARLLNEAWPDTAGALRGNFSQALTEMRKALRGNGRELVLLIDELSAAQGIEGEMLEALAGPSEESLCPLRSIVGMTKEVAGALPDHIRSRLRHTVLLGMPISSQAVAEEGAIESKQLALFAARYLNAARYPFDDLEAWHRNPENRAKPLPSFCLASGCVNRERCHAAFGAPAPDADAGGYGLYPFTAETLLRLYQRTDETCSESSRTFNPGRLINRVLNTVLEAGEQTIPQGNFPPAALLGAFGLDNTSEEFQASRLRRALELYDPARTDLPPGIADAFGLSVAEEKAAEPLPAIAEAQLARDLIEVLWQEHLDADFPPECRGADINGIDVVLLDADTAGCISTFLHHGHRLDMWRLAVIGICYHDLAVVSHDLTGEGKEYFRRLEELAGLVIREVQNSSAQE